MATSQDIQIALANEARRGELRQKVSKLKGAGDTISSLMQRLTLMINDNDQSLTQANAELSALDQGAGPGITSDFGFKSSITQVLEAERAAAKSAAIDFIKANPECTEADAAVVWDAAAIAATGLSTPLQLGATFGQLYTQRLFQGGYITEQTWEAHRQWVLSTPKDVIMAA